MEEENLTFKITLEDGTEVENEVLMTFDGQENGKHYMIYTDHTKDEDDKEKVYAATYDPEMDEQKLVPIETEAEWALIEKVFQSQVEED